MGIETRYLGHRQGSILWRHRCKSEDSDDEYQAYIARAYIGVQTTVVFAELADNARMSLGLIVNIESDTQSLS